jgi:hypothetical protein
MNKEEDIIEQFKNRVDELMPIHELDIRFAPSGFEIGGLRPDIIANVTYKDLHFDLVGEILNRQSSSVFKSKISLLKSYVAKDRKLLPILIAEYLSPARRRQCQQEGVYFLDLSGNVFIEYEGLFIERSGFQNRFPEKRRGRGPFSDKASLILRALLSDVEKIWGIRELAYSVGLDPGYVSRMARELEGRDYITRQDSKLKLRDGGSLLEDWVRNYDYKKNEQAGYFCMAKGPEEIIDKLQKARIPQEIRYALGFQAGANLVAPYSIYNEVHIYIERRDSIDWFREELRLKPAKDGANLTFLSPHYRHSVFYGVRKISALWVVSDLQLYLDLYRYPIRGLEQAEHLYEKRLKRVVEG